MGNCYQLIYTTCQTGISNKGGGFQIYSYSERIPDEYKDESEGVRKTCKYGVPSVNCATPGIPTPEEIETLYPINYTYSFLNSNAYFVSRNKYVGLDNVGTRYGNYISHVMTLENCGHYPISGVYSSLFRDDLSDSEKNSDELPPFLGVVSDDQLFEDDELFVEKIKDFLNEDSDRIGYLGLMISAVFDYFKNGKKIIICDTQENIVMWIAAITRAFPLYIAKEITFSTYAFNPLEADVAIAGVLKEGTSYSAQAASQYGIFNIFDFENNYFSDVNQSGNYMDVVETGLTVSYPVLRDYHDFMEEFGYDIKGGYCDELYYAYNMFRGNLEGYGVDELNSIFQYVLNSSSKSFQNEFVKKISAFFNDSYEQDVDKVFIYLKFGFSFAENAGSSEMLSNMSYIYWGKLLNLVNDYDQVGMDKIKMLQNNVILSLKSGMKCIDAALVSNEVVDMVVQSIKQDTILYHNSFWMEHLMMFMERNGVSIRDFAQKYNAGILREIYYNVAAMKNPANAIENMICDEAAVSLVYDTYQTFIDMFKQDDSAYLEISENLYSRIKARNDYAMIWKYMLQIKDRRLFELKYDMICYCIQNVNMSSEKFIAFEKDCKYECADFASEYLDKVGMEYYKRLASSKCSLEEIRNFLAESVALAQSAAFLEELVEEFDASIDLLKKQDVNTIIPFIKALKARNHRFQDTKAYAAYIMLEKVFVSENKSHDIELLNKCSFEKLSKDECNHILKKIVKFLSAGEFTAETHEQILSVTESMKLNRWDVYPHILTEYDDKKNTLLNSYFVYAFKNKLQDCQDGLFDIFVSYSARKVESYKEQNVAYFNGRNKDVGKEFANFMDDVVDYIQNNKQSVVDKFKNLFSRKD